MGIKEILVFLILFGANLLQAITGFAGTLISMPPTMKLIGVDFLFHDLIHEKISVFYALLI
mgnify:CR=1 FL=1